MSVVSEASWQSFLIANPASPLTIPFCYFHDTEVRVTRRRAGVDTDLLINVDYTVNSSSGGCTAGQFDGIIEVAGSGWIAGDTVVISRGIPVIQESTFPYNGQLPSQTVEASYDKIVMQLQKVEDRVERALRLPIADQGINPLSVNDRSNNVLGFDANGDIRWEPLNLPTDQNVTIGYSPTNYVASGNLLVDHLQGINTALAGSLDLTDPGPIGTAVSDVGWFTEIEAANNTGPNRSSVVIANPDLNAGIGRIFAYDYTQDEVTNLLLGGEFGSVGVGTTIFPANTFGVVDTNRGSLGIESKDAGAGFEPRIRLKHGVSDIFTIEGGADLTFKANDGVNERMRITTAGNVGIGSVNPMSRLVVSNTGNEGIEMNAGAQAGVGAVEFFNRGTSQYIDGSIVGNILRFYSGLLSTESMTIENGSVGIGTADINGGTIDGTTIGATTPSTVAATSLSASTQVDFFGRLFGLDVSNETRLYAGSAGLSIYDHVGTGRILNLTQSSTKVGVVGTGDVATFTSTGLGIGLTAPAPAGTGKSTLDVNGPVLARGGVSLNQTSAGGLDFNNNDFRIRSWGATAGTGSISFRTGGGGGSLDSEAMRISQSGNVGINDTTPSYKLDVNGTFRSTGALWNDDSINLNRNGAGYVRHRYIDQPLRFGVTNTAGTLYYPLEINPSSDYVRFSRDGGAETMRIDSSGNVGVGTAAPAAPLHVFKGSVSGATELARFQGGSGSQNYRNFISLYTTNPSYWWETSLQDPSGGGAQNNLTFVENSAGTRTERMMLKSGGDVIIGAMSLPDGTNDAFGYDRANSFARIGRSTTGAASQMRFYNPNGEVGSISTSGSATAYNTSSDYRLKENVVPMSDSLQRIGNLKPSRFNFIADDSVVVDGFIAHEVEEVVPEAISGEKDAMRDEEYEVTPAVLDDDGNEVTPAVMGTRSVPEYQGIDQSKLVPLLVGAVQELTARLEALENN